MYNSVAQSTLDSLKAIEIENEGFENKLIIYHEIIRNSINDEDSTIKYSKQLLELSTGKSLEFLCKANSYLGQAYMAKGEYQTALRYLLGALKVSQNVPRNNRAVLYGILGGLYNKLNEPGKMRTSYLSAIEEYRKGMQHSDSLGMATILINMAESYFDQGINDSSLFYYDKARVLCESLGLDQFQKIIDGYVGLVYADLNEYDKAEPRLLVAIEAVRNFGDVLSLTTYLNQLGKVYLETNRTQEAQNRLEQSLEIAMENGLKEQIRDASRLLSDVYMHTHEFEKSLTYYKQYETYKDSIENVATVKAMADMRTEYEVGQKQAELDLMTAQHRIERIVMIGISILALVLVILAMIIYKYYRSKARVNAILETQKELLENQKQELEALNETKDKFFSIVSHDLRGPVSSFFGISRMIKYLVKSKETNQLLEIADDIDQSVERLSNLLDNLLSWATQQRGHIPYVPEKISAKSLADDLVKTLANMAKGKSINLQANVDEEIELWADRNTSMTIIRNLVNNSLKFTPEGGQVTISAEKEDDQAVIKVRDTGVGIPAEKLENIFTLQDKKSTYGTSGEKGLGLGLQLVHEFVLLNQGEISVTSEEGKGTTFTVKLPVFVEDAPSVLRTSPLIKERTVKS